MNKNVPFNKPSKKMGAMHMPFAMATGDGCASRSEGGQAKVTKSPQTSATPKNQPGVRNASLPAPGVNKGAKTIQKQNSQSPNYNYAG